VERGSQEEAPVRRPGAVRRIGGVDGADLGEGGAVEDVGFAGQTAKPCKGDEPALRGEGDEVVRRGAEVVYSPYTPVEEHGLRRPDWAFDQ
jgi:hypothetical protein